MFLKVLAVLSLWSIEKQLYKLKDTKIINKEQHHVILENSLWIYLHKVVRENNSYL